MPAHWDQPTMIPRHSSVVSRQPSAANLRNLFIYFKEFCYRLNFIYFCQQNEIVGLNKMRVVCRVSTSSTIKIITKGQQLAILII